MHPGYGFLSENPEFADACSEAGLIFIGPPADVMRKVGNKVSARELAKSAGVPVMPATDPLPDDLDAAFALAEAVGYPLMLKASWGGGGPGHAGDPRSFQSARGDRGGAARGAGGIWQRRGLHWRNWWNAARHVEVQVLGDAHGNLVHLF